jgi:hypothetical protein
MYKTKIFISYTFGSYDITFEKEFNLPFVPNPGISILDTDNEMEMDIELYSTDHRYVSIQYDVKDDEFIIDIRKPMRKGFEIYDVIDSFSETKWIRTDTTNIEQLIKML